MFIALQQFVDGFRLHLRTPAPAARPPRMTMVESLEGRELLSASVGHVDAGAIVAAPAAVTQPLANAAKLAKRGVTSVLPLQITNVVRNANGTFTANGLLGTNPFTALVTLEKAAGSTAAVPILSLHLGEIHLDLLGLNVDTSEICLDVAAQPGGGLLGDLLSGVAGLLNGGTPINTILGGLSTSQLTTLTNGLTNLLNGALQQITAPAAVAGTGSTAAAGNVTDILNLSLGPVDLNLLGLTVSLDDCHNGPVTVDITAESGSGKLLGNLLGGLSRLLDNGASNVAVANSLGRISDAIRGLI